MCHRGQLDLGGLASVVRWVQGALGPVCSCSGVCGQCRAGAGNECCWCLSPACAVQNALRHLDQRRRPHCTGLCRYRRVPIHRQRTGRTPVCGMGHIRTTSTKRDPKARPGATGCWETLTGPPRHRKGRCFGRGAAPMAEIWKSTLFALIELPEPNFSSRSTHQRHPSPALGGLWPSGMLIKPI